MPKKKTDVPESVEEVGEQPVKQEAELESAPKSEEPKAVQESADQKTARSFREKRYFILDTNVLLHDSNALYTFQGVVVGVPFVVLEELDKYKTEQGELGRNAREVIRQLDSIREQGSLSEGVRIQRDGVDVLIKVLYLSTSAEHGVCANDADNQIILILQELIKQGIDATFVTKDINARVKADALNIPAEDYTKGTISLETFYKGWIRVPVPSGDLKTVSGEKVKGLVDVSVLAPNQFVVVESENNPENNRLFRYLGGNQFKVVTEPTTLGTFGAKNTEQLMALDLLMDDAIQIVSLIGPAGTGKTFLALLAGLYKVVKARTYRKFLVSRPIVALGADVGYLPGELKEKLHHWMMPIYDNLEYIFSELGGDYKSKGKGKRHGEQEEDEFGDTAKDRRHKRRHPKGFPGRRELNKVEQLERKGILNMEAITYMRGRSIPHQFILIDEVQNLTPHEVKTLVSRAGEGTKIVLCGDPHQIDSHFLNFTSNGLTVTAAKFRGQPIFGTVYLEISERSELAKISAKIL